MTIRNSPRGLANRLVEIDIGDRIRPKDVPVELGDNIPYNAELLRVADFVWEDPYDLVDPSPEDVKIEWEVVR